MFDLKTQSKNNVTLVGKLMEISFRSGTTAQGKPYESANYTLRVNNHFNGHTEVSEIPCSTFATKFTNAGKANPTYNTIEALKEMKTIQTHGEAEADTISVRSGEVRENNFVSRNGQIVHGWQLNASFVSKAKLPEVAMFDMNIFIMDMHDEEDSDGNPTGRLIIRGGVVRYGETLDVLDFVVEAPDHVQYISRAWNVNDTVNVKGYIRVTAIENQPAPSSSWGEVMPETTTRMVRELIICSGSDEPYDEEFAYDPVAIRQGFNERKARLEQLQADAANRKAAAPTAKSANTPSTKPSYAWEE